MNRLPLALCATVLAACAAAGPAWAETLTTTFEVTLDVASHCTLVATAPVDFGTTLASTTTERIATGRLGVECNFPTAYTITLDGGRNGTVGDRRMVNSAGDTIAYRLYSDAAGNCSAQSGAPWGDGSSGTCTLSASHDGNGAEQAVPIEGRLTLSNPSAGTYSDTVTATITY